MAGKKLAGVVAADVIEARFAYSGRVMKVNKRPGDKVKKLNRPSWM